MKGPTTFTLQEIAATVKQQHPSFGPKKIFILLRKLNIIFKVGTDHFTHKQYIDEGYLQKHTSSYTNTTTNAQRERHTVVVTEKGAGWLINIIYKELSNKEKAA